MKKNFFSFYYKKIQLFLLNISLVQKFRYPLFSVIIVLPILPYRRYFLLSFEEKF